MLGARFQRSAANQGIWRLTAIRPDQPLGLPATNGSNEYVSVRSPETTASDHLSLQATAGFDSKLENRQDLIGEARDRLHSAM